MAITLNREASQIHERTIKVVTVKIPYAFSVDIKRPESPRIPAAVPVAVILKIYIAYALLSEPVA